MCEDVRTALSARLDGEEPGLSDDLVDAHRTGCPGCQAWLDGARRVVRVVRTMEQRVPDLTESTMRAVEADPQVGGLAFTRGRRSA
jgi:predicted anti-sigma-YlaC factor YlaD